MQHRLPVSELHALLVVAQPTNRGAHCALDGSAATLALEIRHALIIGQTHGGSKDLPPDHLCNVRGRMDRPKRLYIMQGVPGSGKTTVAQMLRAYLAMTPIFSSEDFASVTVRSTDDYRYGDCGHYIHDVAKNAELHARTQREVADDMRDGVNYVIVDNTNIEKQQAMPYICLARMYGYEIDVVRVDPGLAESKKRNRTRPNERRVPDEVIESMYSRLENLL